MIDSLSFVGKVNGEKTQQRHRMKGKKGMEKNQLANKYGILMSFVERNSNNFGIGSNLRAEKLFPTPSKSTFPNRRLCSIKCAQATTHLTHGILRCSDNHRRWEIIPKEVNSLGRRKMQMQRRNIVWMDESIN